MRNTLIEKYNNGVITYAKFTNDNEIWREYDENNNCIYFKDSDGNEEWYDYDENNNLINIRNYND